MRSARMLYLSARLEGDPSTGGRAEFQRCVVTIENMRAGLGYSRHDVDDVRMAFEEFQPSRWTRFVDENRKRLDLYAEAVGTFLVRPRKRYNGLFDVRRVAEYGRVGWRVIRHDHVS